MGAPHAPLLLLLLAFVGVGNGLVVRNNLIAQRRGGSALVGVGNGLVVRRRGPPPPTATALEVIPPSYDLALAFLAISTAFVPGEAGSLAAGENPQVAKTLGLAVGLPVAIFGAFLAFQTTNLRFTFDDSAFSLVKSDLSTTGENVVVGGENRWAYKSFVNYDVFPNKDYPVLVYFKETQTPKEFWNVGPGEQANSPEALAKGAVEGQVHFFPAIGNVDMILEGFRKNACAKLP